MLDARRLLPPRQNARVLAYALLVAAAVLFFCSKSSFGYPINDWSDANIYFTIGKGMTRGQVVYRDLYDHKGPLLFILYALGAAISDTSFIGVFALEALSLAAAVYAGWRTVRLFGEGRLTLLAMPLLAAATCCCTAFTQGGSAEEFRAFITEKTGKPVVYIK